MAGWERRLQLTHPFPRVKPHLLDEAATRRWLEGLQLKPNVLQVADAQPADAYPGTAMVISGTKFSDSRFDNQVEVGGKPAFVVEASQNRLFVLTDPQCETGPVKVTVGSASVEAPNKFVARPWPAPGTNQEAPPYSFFGRGLPGSGPGGGPLPGGGASAGTIPPTGTAKVLVIVCNPTDKVPPDLTAARNGVVSTFDNVTTFYDQVSYGTLAVEVDVTTFVPLLENADYYHRPNGANGYPNVDNAVIPQLTAEAAQGAVDQGFNLDDYSVMAVLIYLPGLSVRAWGGWAQQDFTYNDGAGTAISLVSATPISMIVARHDADWGRAAHEFGHNLVDGGLVLGEDVYSSDLVDGSQATAQAFELMGDHDSHPMFSGLFMDQLGYYSAANIKQLQWDRNPFQEEFDVVAHGSALDSAASKFNLIKIKVSPGLAYYVEVRQKPPAGSTQVYDTNIPVPAGSGRNGGVIVTKAITDVLDNNQQTRLVTLLHDPTVLLTGDIATDPLRALKITVVNDQVSTNPLVCKVRVEWAQAIGDTPGGDFDLSLTPWGPGYETVDIWIDRLPYGSFDFTDPSGNPTGNGDEPRPLEINRFWARVHNSGIAATNVRMTYYSVTPPGVGDNGTWTPLQTKVIASVPASNTSDEFVNWIPVVGEHTCLKVVAEGQLGEVSVGNNSAQENVFNFQPAASSVPEPVSMQVAVRNPRDEEAVVHIRLFGVPEGYRVYLPFRWVTLPAKGQMTMDLLVAPAADFERLDADMKKVKRKDQKGIDPAARIRVLGQIERGYSKEVGASEVPGSWFWPIGGISARVEPKRMANIKLEEDRRHKDDQRVVAVRGFVQPVFGGQALRVDLEASNGKLGHVIATTDANGQFSAQFVLEKLEGQPALRVGNGRLSRVPPQVARLGRLGETLSARQVRYQVQAHIFNASQLAPASSNVVMITR